MSSHTTDLVSMRNLLLQYTFEFLSVRHSMATLLSITLFHFSILINPVVLISVSNSTEELT